MQYFDPEKAARMVRLAVEALEMFRAEMPVQRGAPPWAAEISWKLIALRGMMSATMSALIREALQLEDETNQADACDRVFIAIGEIVGTVLGQQPEGTAAHLFGLLGAASSRAALDVRSSPPAPKVHL